MDRYPTLGKEQPRRETPCMTDKEFMARADEVFGRKDGEERIDPREPFITHGDLEPDQLRELLMESGDSGPG